MSKSISGIQLVPRRDKKGRQPLCKVCRESYVVGIPAYDGTATPQFIVLDIVDHTAFTLENAAVWWQTAIPAPNANDPLIQLGYVKAGDAINNTNFVPMTNTIALDGTALTLREFTFNSTVPTAPTGEPLTGVLPEGGVLVAKLTGEIEDTTAAPFDSQTIHIRTRGYEGLNF